MAFSIVDTLGIYPGDIDRAWDTCMDVLEQQKLDRFAKELGDSLQDEITEVSMQDPTNSIIGLMFNICKGIIEREHPGQEVTYYVNCSDSHLYPGIDPESTEGRLQAAGLTIEEKDEILKDEGFVNDLTELFESGGDIVIYESETECGEDNRDNGCRTEEDTDEQFCRFLASNYLNNYSDIRDICVILSSGRVIQASVEGEEATAE